MKGFSNKIKKLVNKISSGPVVKKIFPILSSFFLILLFSFFVYKFVFGRAFFVARHIAFEVEQISNILKEVDDYCNILSIRADKNLIDFLTVKEFAGSEIGCLNLAYPKQWKGPYVPDNSTIQGKLFEIIKAADGYFVVPGDGVKLPNGKVMGKDVIITPQVPVGEMVAKDGLLSYKGIALAKKLDFKIGDWDFPPKTKEKVKKLDKSIEEFNEALPYT
ncbi:TPA: hypothetical protein DEO28_04105 [Candidatus Dependentiae bacterium]|nr:MAG: hypothetical protein UR14_C0006G0058 [candidate division TM6 bacterium GW2011_GWE2_31_21]KKP53519.1 MAG: hypothetical protein UR43_C0004G0060 [candidate division TM6 bacterium GW2011_GWF2_33_332]HBS48240.1 hypothetical protein [Candidatus Dependentiae bacterium]HBZ73666.1 hypothetical protein [Candidatus Dependentiae bacterium]